MFLFTALQTNIDTRSDKSRLTDFFSWSPMNELSRQNTSSAAGSIALRYLLVLAAAAALYVATCAPTILWQDSALFVYRIWHNDIQGDLGIALAHPLYIMIGIAVKYLPLGELAYRINLISALSGAIAIANLFLLLRLWLDKNLPAVIAAVTLALSWNFWQHAVIAETYTLCAAQIFAELIMLLLYTRTKRIGYLYLLALLNGLTIANHLWGVFGLACYTVFVILLLARRQISPKSLSIIILLWIIGAAPYEYLILRNLLQSGDFSATMTSALFGAMWRPSVLNTSISLKIVLENLIFILLNFPTPNIVLIPIGLWAIHKTHAPRPFTYILTTMLLLHFVFAFRYTVPDRYAFFLPFYCLAAVFVGLGADVFLKRFNHRAVAFLVLAFALLPIPTYCLTPTIAKKFYKPLGQRRQRPYRDEYVYFLQPWKTGYRGAERFANEALNTVEKNAIIYAYTTDVHALLYVQQVKGKRSDVKIVSDYDMSENAPVFSEDTIEQLLKISTIYVTSPVKGYCPAFLLQRYDFEKSGVLWKVSRPD